MSHQPAAIVSLTEPEFALFLPGALRTRLREMLPHGVFIDPSSANGSWGELLQQHRPEIIISGWGTAPIPADIDGLKYVCHVAGSVRKLVPRALLERGVLVGNWGGTVAEMVAEGALGMILAALRRTQHFGDIMHRQKTWENAPAGALSLFERRVGIHGFGAIVRRLLPMLRVFRCPVRVFTTGVPDAWYAEHGVERADSLEQLFDWADVLVEAEALTPSNHGIVDEKLLRRLRPDGVFVNIARGALVDEAALAKVAAEGWLRLALDVFQTEPLPADSPLRGLSNAVLSPHTAGPTQDRACVCGKYALDNLQRYLQGGMPETRVTLEIYDRST